MNDTAKAAALGALAGGCTVALLWFLTSKRKEQSTDPGWDYRKVKKNLLELIGHTPMLRLDSLSTATGNEIFVGTAY